MIRVAKQLIGLRPVRYLITGGGLFLIDLGVFLMCVKVGDADIRVAQVIARVVGATVGFFGHKIFSFKMGMQDGAAKWVAQGVGYTLVTVFNIVISPFVVYLAIRVAGGSLVPGKIIAEVFLVLETYLLLHVVFTTRKSSQQLE